MDRNSVEWKGYLPAITTPFDADGELDLQAARQLARWMVSEGMHGLILAGTTGEWFSMNALEKSRFCEVVCQEVNGERPVLMGCNAFTAAEAVNNARAAAAAGADGILLTPPPYIRLSEPETFAFYKFVNDEIDLPICVYNWPPGTGVDLSVSILSELADFSNVVAIKNSTSRPEHFLDVLIALKERVRIFGIPMTKDGIEIYRTHGGDGTMGAGAVLGRMQPGFYDALWAGQFDEAEALAAADEKIMRAWYRSDLTAQFGSAQAILKAALNYQGLPGGWPRPPILPLDRDDERRVISVLEEMGLTRRRANIA